MKGQDIGFVGWFVVLLVIVLVAIFLAPQPVLPERSEYLSEEREIQELRAGRVTVIFFYNLQSTLCQQQGKMMQEAVQGREDVLIQWINVAEYSGDRRVIDLVDKYEVDATPVIIIKNLHFETRLVGSVSKTKFLSEINKLNPA